MPFRIRDPVHNFIVLPNRLQAIVNTRPLQRLRGIRQLALACLVYPGALHTRFDHTLGVAHVAGLMAKHLELPPDESDLVQLAGLLHDVGHGPFSHVSETSLARYAKRDALKQDQKHHKIHELVTAAIIQTDSELANLLDVGEADAVVQLLQDGNGRRLLKQIVSGPLDADKQDYLLRDGQFCGVEYGRFDLHQFQRSLKAVGEPGGEELMIDADGGVHAAEQFMLAKYYMTANVYRHHVRTISDQMIVRAITLGIEADELEQLRELYEFDNSAGFITNYLGWDDARFMETFCPMTAAPPGPLSGKMLMQLRERRLLKRVYSERIEALDARCRETVRDFGKPNRDVLRGSIEAEAAAFLSKELNEDCEREFVIAHSFGIKSVRESSQNDEGEVLVECGGGGPKFFSEESKLLGSINDAFSDNFVEVYAPIEWPNRDERDALRENWRGPIRDIIQNACHAERRKPQ